MVDHLINTDLINRLNLKDVHAPASKELTDEFKVALQKQLGRKMREVLNEQEGNWPPAMISPMAPGSKIWELLGRTNDDSGKKTLLDYVITKNGAHALGALIMIDLLDGMYDRLFTFNGNNFLFDPATKELWCIDNAKNPDWGLLATDDRAWKQWVIGRNNALDDNNDTSTDKGKSVPELLHWMIYERKQQNTPGFGPEIHWSDWPDEAKKQTAAWTKEAFTDTCSALQKLANDTGLAPKVRARLRERLAFLDARNKFIGQLREALVSLAEFETIPTPKNPWFGRKLLRKAQQKIGQTTMEQVEGLRLKTLARDKTMDDDQLEALDSQISAYITKHQKVDDRILKALFAVRSARFVRSLKEHTEDLVNLQKLNGGKAWGTLDPAVTSGIQKSAAAWVKELRKAGDEEGAQEVETATQAFLNQLNG